MIRRILAPFVLWLYRHLFIFEQDTLGTAEWRVVDENREAFDTLSPSYRPAGDSRRMWSLLLFPETKKGPPPPK